MEILVQVLVQIEREAASASAAAATASESKSEHKSSGHVTFEDGKQSSGGDEGSSDCEDIAALVRNWEESAAEEFISALTEPGRDVCINHSSLPIISIWHWKRSFIIIMHEYSKLMLFFFIEILCLLYLWLLHVIQYLRIFAFSLAL